MKRMCFTLCLALLAVPALAKESNPVAEVFGCKLLPGKTMADFDAATKVWQQQIANLREFDDHLAAVMVPFRARSEYDLLWFGFYDNVNALARGDVAYMAKSGPQIEEQFAAVARCESGLFWSKTLLDALPNEPGDDEALVELFACKLNAGKTLSDLDAPDAAQLAAIKALKALDPKYGNIRLRVLTPWYADTPYNVIYMGVNDDAESFARDATTWVNSKEGAAVDAGYANAATCASGLWRAHRIHAPKAMK